MQTWPGAWRCSKGMGPLTWVPHVSALHALQVRDYAPEVLVLAPCGHSVAATRAEVCQLAGLPGWWSLPAVKAGAVYILDHALLCRPGPRSQPCLPSCHASARQHCFPASGFVSVDRADFASLAPSLGWARTMRRPAATPVCRRAACAPPAVCQCGTWSNTPAVCWPYLVFM